MIYLLQVTRQICYIRYSSFCLIISIGKCFMKFSSLSLIVFYVKENPNCFKRIPKNSIRRTQLYGIKSLRSTKETGALMWSTLQLIIGILQISQIKEISQFPLKSQVIGIFLKKLMMQWTISFTLLEDITAGSIVLKQDQYLNNINGMQMR